MTAGGTMPETPGFAHMAIRLPGWPADTRDENSRDHRLTPRQSERAWEAKLTCGAGRAADRGPGADLLPPDGLPQPPWRSPALCSPWTRTLPPGARYARSVVPAGNSGLGGRMGRDRPARLAPRAVAARLGAARQWTSSASRHAFKAGAARRAAAQAPAGGARLAVIRKSEAAEALPRGG